MNLRLVRTAQLHNLMLQMSFGSHSISKINKQTNKMAKVREQIYKHLSPSTFVSILGIELRSSAMLSLAEKVNVLISYVNITVSYYQEPCNP